MRKRNTQQTSNTTELPSFTQDEIKNEGKVYTPYVIIDNILQRYQPLLSHTQRICDPSMGHGNFLRRLFDQYLVAGLSPTVAFTNLYGCDIDDNAIANAREYFVAQGVPESIVNTNIRCINPITEADEWYSYFDIVIGNPPYVRSPVGIPVDYTLRSNLVDVFFEVGVRLLVDHGTLIYIVQDSFLTNEDAAVRTYLGRHNVCTLEPRYDYSKIFRQHDVAVDICLVEVQKNTPQTLLVSVWKHQPFQLAATIIKQHTKWNIYPERVISLNDKLQQYTDALPSHVEIKKGRLEGRIGSIAGTYGSKTYSKEQTTVYDVPVIGEPNLNYFFPITPFDFKNFTKRTSATPSTTPFAPYIALPYFTSKFRFCLIEDDVLTTPLVYVLNGANLTWLLPLLNNDVTDFQLRYNTKSRDTGYEFKKSSFDAIRFPNISPSQKKHLASLVDFIRTGNITAAESNDWVLEHIYKISDADRLLLVECKQYWFKKHVQSIKNPPSI